VLLAIGRGEQLPPINAREILITLGAAVFPTVVGHTALNWSMRHLRSQVVSTANLAQFVIVAVLAVPILGEYPPLAFYPAAALIVAGALIVIRGATPAVRREIAHATESGGG
jgi:drug/metabolite transporter (DMT)-like permease